MDAFMDGQREAAMRISSYLYRWYLYIMHETCYARCCLISGFNFGFGLARSAFDSLS